MAETHLNNEIYIIGSGNMGGAIALGLVRQNQYQPHMIDIDSSKLLRFSCLGVPCYQSMPNVPGRRVVLLAIPPQSFREFARTWRGDPDDVVISVMAGIRSQVIAECLGVTQVVRTIPNTPSEVFGGMTVAFASPSTTSENLDLARQILEGVGRVLTVENEDLIDDATALCGGGPAFVAYFAAAMQEFAELKGFSRADAAAMTNQVIRGTADLIEVSQRSASQVCKDVQTPNGTTERGIRRFDDARFAEIVRLALECSSARSKELGLTL